MFYDIIMEASEASNKQIYRAPSTTVFEVKSRGVICNTSPNNYPVWETENI